MAWCWLHPVYLLPNKITPPSSLHCRNDFVTCEQVYIAPPPIPHYSKEIGSGDVSQFTPWKSITVLNSCHLVMMTKSNRSQEGRPTPTHVVTLIPNDAMTFFDLLWICGIIMSGQPSIPHSSTIPATWLLVLTSTATALSGYIMYKCIITNTLICCA